MKVKVSRKKPFSIKVIKIKDIQLSKENPRYEPVENQEKTIEKIIEDQDNRLFFLARDILIWGINPHDPIQVYLSKNKKYVVLEGNRRICVLKLLDNPNLIDDQKSPQLKKKFEKLHKENKSRILHEVECAVYNNPKDAEHWIGLKHGYGEPGVGTENWAPLQKDRWKEKTEEKASRVLQIIKKMKSSKNVSQEIKDKLIEINTSNLDRLINDPDVRGFLGLEMHDGLIYSKIDEKEVMKGLVQIIKDILDPRFNVRKIYTKDERKIYLNNFPKKNIPNKRIKAKKSWRFTTSTAPLPSTKAKPYSKYRNTLIPSTFKLRIGNTKINDIFDELKKIKIEKFTNSVAVLFRVFTELSLDVYIEKNLPKKQIKNLQQKIFVVANQLEHKKWVGKNICKGIKMAVKDKNNILGIDTWQAYVHNPHFSPSPKDLMLTWNNIQIFIEKIWEHT